ncbi:unnamed protein product, partial [Ceratitis capitata]
MQKRTAVGRNQARPRTPYGRTPHGSAANRIKQPADVHKVAIGPSKQQQQQQHQQLNQQSTAGNSVTGPHFICAFSNHSPRPQRPTSLSARLACARSALTSPPT